MLLLFLSSFIYPVLLKKIKKKFDKKISFHHRLFQNSYILLHPIIDVHEFYTQFCICFSIPNVYNHHKSYYHTIKVSWPNPLY